MQTTLTVPLDPPSWCRSPDGYVKHQKLLQKLIDYLVENGVFVRLPEEIEGRHDNGIDLYVGEGEVIVDLKSFWLTDSPKTRTWMSPFHRSTSGRRATWSGKETEVYVHAREDVPVDQWLACRADNLRLSYCGDAPFYYKENVKTVVSLT